MNVVERKIAVSGEGGTATAYRPDVDGLRALSVLAVIGFHAFPRSVRSGFIGVDVFFVISGFLITGLILKDLGSKKFSVLTFYARRVRRIFPSLIVVMTAALFAGWFMLLPAEYAELGKHVLGGAGFAANFFSWAESGYFDRAVEMKPLLHLWSLGVEEQFYLVWPLLLVGSASLRGGPAKVTMGFAAASFVLCILSIFWGAAGSYFSPFTRFWELLAGGMLAFAARYRPSFAVTSMLPSGRFSETQARSAISVLGLALLLLSVFTLNRSGPYPGVQALLPVVAAVLLVWAGETAWLNKKVLASPPLVHIGKISYPLYLWHWPLFSFATIQSGARLQPGSYGMLIFFAWLLAFLTYRLIEKPLRFGLYLRQKALLLCTAMILMGGAGLAVFFDRGIPSHVPKEIGRFLDYRFDFFKAYRTRECMLWGDQEPTAFGNCVIRKGDVITRRIALWGDSHAAHLWPGLENHLPPGVELTQLTTAGCAPIPDVAMRLNGHCPAANAYILARLKREKPDTVILSARWAEYEGLFDWSRLLQVIADLRGAGIKSVYVIGPSPVWQVDLPRCLWRAYMLTRAVPERMSSCLSPEPFLTDKALRRLFQGTAVHYVSALDILCNQGGCLTRTGDSGKTLTTLDEAHLMPAGSDLLVSRFPPDLLSATPPP